MARVSDDTIQAVKEAADIVDVVSRYVTLKRAGASYKGLCPFHDDSNPSFSVSPSRQSYKCFACGEGGNVITFLMKKANLGFREALADLAKDAGIVLPEEREVSPEVVERRHDAQAALRFAAGFFKAILHRESGAAALSYLLQRGIEKETIETFDLGFSPDEWEGLRNYAKKKGFSEQALVDAGLLRRRDDGRVYDMFRGRIMFPIHDLAGHVIGFGARAMGDAQPKYLNSPDGPLFHKGRELYGLRQARRAAVEAGRVLVTEGYTDVLLCHQAGLKETVAGLGTALTSQNANNLRRVAVPVHLVYDGDQAGRRAAERAAGALLEERVEGVVAILPEGRDPADLIVEQGRDGLERILAGAVDLWEFRVNEALNRHSQGSLDGESAALRELVDGVARIADPLRQGVAFKLLAEKFHVSELTLRNASRPPRRVSVRENESDPSTTGAQNSHGAPAWLKMEGELLGACLLDPSLWARVEEVYPPSGFQDPVLRLVAQTFGGLMGRGREVTRETLWAELEETPEALFALERLETPEDLIERAQLHLNTLVDRRRRRRVSARDSSPVARRPEGDVTNSDGTGSEKMDGDWNDMGGHRQFSENG